MSICRAIHNKNYTVVNNTICSDKRLSYKAKGIWLYAFSRPDDWTFYMKDIINQSNDKKTKIQSGLKELENCGYLKRTKKQDQKGKITYEWEFYEVPVEIKKILPQQGFPCTGKPSTGNQPLLSTDKLSTEETSNCSVARVRARACSHDKKRESIKKESVEYTNGKGENKEISASEIFKYFVRHNYSTDIIKRAISIANEYEGPINDILKFLEGTCKNIHVTEKKEKKIEEPKAKEEEKHKTFEPGVNFYGKKINI